MEMYNADELNWMDHAGFGCRVVAGNVVSGRDQGVALDAVPGIFSSLMGGCFSSAVARKSSGKAWE